MSKDSLRVWLIMTILTAMLSWGFYFYSKPPKLAPSLPIKVVPVFQTREEEREFKRLLAYHGPNANMQWEEHGVWHFWNEKHQKCHFVWPKERRL